VKPISKSEKKWEWERLEKLERSKRKHIEEKESGMGEGVR
jgi:hypothetical protein